MKHNYNTTTAEELNPPRPPMTFAELSKIWDRQQRIKAKGAITKKDRAKTTLTYKEKLNKFAQLGNKVRFGDMYFTFDTDTGMGLLVTPNSKTLGATLDEFLALAKAQGAKVSF